MTAQNSPALLYLAAQHGCHGLLEDILAKFPDLGKLLNTPDALQCWTPLMVASAEGYVQTVKIFTQLRADPAARDSKGWTTKDHAAFRGKLEIAEWFEDREAREHGRHSHFSVHNRGNTQHKTTLHSQSSYQRPLPVAKDKTQILLSLGPANTRSDLKGVDINPLLVYHGGDSCDHSGFRAPDTI